MGGGADGGGRHAPRRHGEGAARGKARVSACQLHRAAPIVSPHRPASAPALPASRSVRCEHRSRARGLREVLATRKTRDSHSHRSHQSVHSTQAFTHQTCALKRHWAASSGEYLHLLHSRVFTPTPAATRSPVAGPLESPPHVWAVSQTRRHTQPSRAALLPEQAAPATDGRSTTREPHWWPALTPTPRCLAGGC